MTKFQYTAVSPKGRSLNGIIEAESTESAKNKLYSLKLSVLTLEPISENKLNQANFSKYKFEATDKQNKKVVGTISSSNLLSAFQKLVKEYDLTILKLSSLNASNQEFENSQQLIPNLYQQIEQLDSNLENDNSKQEYDQNKQQAEFQKTIEKIIELIKNIQVQYSDKLKPETLEFLQKYELHLNKIKFSDNIESTSNSALKVLKHLEESELILNLSQNNQEQFDFYMNLAELSHQVKVFLKKENDLSSNFEKILNKIGLKLSNSKNQFNKTVATLKILLQTKSNQFRQTIFSQLIKQLFSKNISKSNTVKNNFLIPETKLTKTETELLNLTNWLLPIFCIFYFISVFTTQKITSLNTSSILAIYNTKIIIYLFIGLLLLHFCLKIRQLFSYKKMQLSKINYILVGFLYILIMLNL